jgi:hypothetical protein
MLTTRILLTYEEQESGPLIGVAADYPGVADMVASVHRRAEIVLETVAVVAELVLAVSGIPAAGQSEGCCYSKMGCHLAVCSKVSTFCMFYMISASLEE